MSSEIENSSRTDIGVDPELLRLRTRIDDLDRQLIEILAQRLQVCREVAHIKEHSETPVIQPQRVRDVVTTRRQWAIDTNIDPDFAEQVIRVVLAETHRIEVAGRRLDTAPAKLANTSVDPAGKTIGDLATVTTRIDHVVVAVDDLDQAIVMFTQNLGFALESHDLSPRPGIAVITAGGVTLVLISPAAGSDVARHINTHGTGIHHIAIEVLNAPYARQSLLRGLSGSASGLITDLVIDSQGHEQFFTVRDPQSGVQLGFIARTGHRMGVSDIDTQNLLHAFKDASGE